MTSLFYFCKGSHLLFKYSRCKTSVDWLPEHSTFSPQRFLWLGLLSVCILYLDVLSTIVIRQCGTILFQFSFSHIIWITSSKYLYIPSIKLRFLYWDSILHSLDRNIQSLWLWNYCRIRKKTLLIILGPDAHKLFWTLM